MCGGLEKLQWPRLLVGEQDTLAENRALRGWGPAQPGLTGWARLPPPGVGLRVWVTPQDDCRVGWEGPERIDMQGQRLPEPRHRRSCQEHQGIGLVRLEQGEGGDKPGSGQAWEWTGPGMGHRRPCGRPGSFLAWIPKATQSFRQSKALIRTRAGLSCCLWGSM